MSNESMEKWTMCASSKDKDRYERNGAEMGLSRNAYIRFMTHLGEETYRKIKDSNNE